MPSLVRALFCVRCGGPIGAGNRFCPACGATFVAVVHPTAHRRLGLLAWLVFVLAVVLALVVAAFAVGVLPLMSAEGRAAAQLRDAADGLHDVHNAVERNFPNNISGTVNDPRFGPTPAAYTAAVLGRDVAVRYQEFDRDIERIAFPERVRPAVGELYAADERVIATAARLRDQEGAASPQPMLDELLARMLAQTVRLDALRRALGPAAY